MPAVSRQSFFVGGTYAGPPEARVMHGQMYVEMLKPAKAAHPYPLVLIHGLGQTAMNWLSTPDGRQGWAQWFAKHGWHVCIVDQPARGRSAWQPRLDGTMKTISAALTEKLFTAPASPGSHECRRRRFMMSEGAASRVGIKVGQ